MTATERDRELAARGRFERDTADHVLTVLHDDGLYRHIRMATPRSSFYYFDLITWPGGLTVHGDMGTWTFFREADMFDFFRRGRGLTRINSGYWGEKLKAGLDQGNRTAERYDPDLLEQVIREHVAEFIDMCDWPDDAISALKRYVENDIFDEQGFCEWAWRDSKSEGSRLLQEWSARFTVGSRSYTYEFVDAYEWNTARVSEHFLWICWAIVAGIDAYDQAMSKPVGAAS